MIFGQSSGSARSLYLYVKAATSFKECRDLVNTSERTRRHCMTKLSSPQSEGRHCVEWKLLIISNLLIIALSEFADQFYVINWFINTSIRRSFCHHHYYIRYNNPGQLEETDKARRIRGPALWRPNPKFAKRLDPDSTHPRDRLSLFARQFWQA